MSARQCPDSRENMLRSGQGGQTPRLLPLWDQPRSRVPLPLPDPRVQPDPRSAGSGYGNAPATIFALITNEPQVDEAEIAGQTFYVANGCGGSRKAHRPARRSPTSCAGRGRSPTQVSFRAMSPRRMSGLSVDMLRSGQCGQPALSAAPGRVQHVRRISGRRER
jgi:hypothetical protein